MSLDFEAIPYSVKLVCAFQYKPENSVFINKGLITK